MFKTLLAQNITFCYCTGINMVSHLLLTTLHYMRTCIDTYQTKNYSHLTSCLLPYYIQPNSSVIFWTWLQLVLSTDFKWRVTIFIVILKDYSNGLDSHLVQFHPFFGIISISKTVLENFPVLEPLEKCLLTACNSCQKILGFLWVFISHHHNLARFAFISTISNNSITLFNLIYIGPFDSNFLFCLPLCLHRKLSCHAFLLRRVL